MDEPFWPPENYYRVSLKALIFDDNGRLLVCRDGNNEYGMPGGGWDHGEDYKDGLAREVIEELGVLVAEVGEIAFVYRCSAGQGQPKVSLAFPVKLQSLDFKFSTDDDEVMEARFVTKQEFLRLPFQKGEDPVQQCAGDIWR